jgi:hypothetical protein
MVEDQSNPRRGLPAACPNLRPAIRRDGLRPHGTRRGQEAPLPIDRLVRERPRAVALGGSRAAVAALHPKLTHYREDPDATDAI